jgi:hypothetical protein
MEHWWNVESQISDMCCVGEFFVLQINVIMDKHLFENGTECCDDYTI